jgi:undecaprenyl phosphate-alpha-L-ara4FN deformylase
VLRAKLRLPFAFNSDCRGRSIFLPHGTTQPQVPVTLPTYDELASRHGLDAAGYFRGLETRLVPGGLNVLAVHAEVEGIHCRQAFARFLDDGRARGFEFVPLGSLVASAPSPPPGRLGRVRIAGREGWVASQEPAS